jgi:hypothetical protein
MINLYVEKNVVVNDSGKNFVKALGKLKKASKHVVINIISTDSNNEDLERLREFFDFNITDKGFNDLLESFNPLTKDSVYVSSNTDNLWNWDNNRGKSILVSSQNHRRDSEMGFNRVLLYKEPNEILKKLRMYIHI